MKRKDSSIFLEKWIFFLFIFLFESCSSDENQSREIRGHDEIFQGVGHAVASDRAERYCSLCHGVNLSGGKGFIPSCYKCHGENWSDSESEQSLAPSDHTELKGDYLHHPSLFNPVGSCDSCHGLDLKGKSILNRPSCYLCHDQKWN